MRRLELAERAIVEAMRRLRAVRAAAPALGAEGDWEPTRGDRAHWRAVAHDLRQLAAELDSLASAPPTPAPSPPQTTVCPAPLAPGWLRRREPLPPVR